MYENGQIINAIIYSFYWAIVLYSFFRLIWKHRPVCQWATVRGGSGSERGQGLVEYALILVLVAVVVIGVLVVLGPSIKELF
jgi:pilus assembly protein Flp/PilA